jgi:hypothetical protein
MISQEEIGFKSARELGISPPKQRASVQALGAAPGALIYDPASGSLRYPRFTQLPGGLKSEKLGAHAAFPLHASGGTVGKSSSCRIAGEKHSILLTADGYLYDHQSSGWNQTFISAKQSVTVSARSWLLTFLLHGLALKISRRASILSMSNEVLAFRHFLHFLARVRA